MDKVRWRRMKELFEDAVRRPKEERELWLAEHCTDDPELRAEVLRLVAIDGESTESLRCRVGDELSDGFLGEPISTGRRIDRYHIIDKIGSGGMGVVFLAERADGEFSHRVALKLMNHISQTDLKRRFIQERQILASLHHPYIARLLDGGVTDDDRPYLVMELVEGQPIDKYCGEHALSVTDCVELLAMVCEAVEHAHRNLIVHRDLKPENILITPDGTPKLLDFGIAKLLAGCDISAHSQTVTGPAPLTPEYASPEQLLGDPITTSTDVYSLGLVLYRLLARRKPFQSEMPGAWLAAMNAEIVPPSKVSLRDEPIPGDLDAIVVKALQSEASDRYGSVREFADDLHRFLEGLPVVAVAPTLVYRVRRFAGRNRGVVAASATALVLLVAGVTSTIWQGRIADHERHLAEDRLADLRHLTNRFLFDFHDAIADLPGSTQARELVLSTALEYLDGLSREVAEDPGLLYDLAVAYKKVGDVQGGPVSANLGDLEGAESSYRQALDACTAVEPLTDEFMLLAAHILRALGDAQYMGGTIDEAMDSYEESLSWFDRLTPEQPHDTGLLRDISSLALRLGDARLRLGDVDLALESFERALAIDESLLALNPDDRDIVRDVATSLAKIGWFQASIGQNDLALLHLKRALDLDTSIAADDPNDAIALRDLVLRHRQVGKVFLAAGDLESARLHCQDAHDLAVRRRQQDPLDALATSDLATCLSDLGDILRREGRSTEARALYRQGLALRRELSEHDPSNAMVMRDLTISLERLGNLLFGENRLEEAIDIFEQSLRCRRQLCEANPTDRRLLRDLAVAHYKIGEASLRSMETHADPQSRRRACTAFRQFLAVMDRLDEDGDLSASDATACAEIVEIVAECDAESHADGEAVRRPSPAQGDVDRMGN